MEYWTDLYKEIAARITDNLPEIAWVDLWHEQVNYLTEELPFPVPAVFLAFDTIQTDDRGKLIQDCNTQIDMYLFYETFSDTYTGSLSQNSALVFLNQLTRLHALFHGKSGSTFSAIRRVELRREDSGGAGNLYRISFQCLITDYSAQRLFTESQTPSADIAISTRPTPPSYTEDEPFFHP
jgi:hypothetical protein|nr:MAG TPA: hypothetical protein [Caudoviricetes sp.]